MLQAAIFDLDGTLLRTEHIKAESYALAVEELRSSPVDREEVFEAYTQVLGHSRQQVATHIMETFDLSESAAARMSEFEVSSPWQAFVQVRLAHHERLVEDPGRIKEAICPNNMKLFKAIRADLPKIGLATMSGCKQTRKILGIIGIRDQLDFLATADDIHHGKPDPEIYRIVINELGVGAHDVLVIEDSATGVQAALAAGAHCLAAVSELTEDKVRGLGLLDPEWIVADPKLLIPTYRRLRGQLG